MTLEQREAYEAKKRANKRAKSRRTPSYERYQSRPDVEAKRAKAHKTSTKKARDRAYQARRRLAKKAEQGGAAAIALVAFDLKRNGGTH